MLTRALLAVPLACAAVFLPAAAAQATGGGGVAVGCTSGPAPGCDVDAHTPGQTRPNGAVVAQPGDTVAHQTCSDFVGEIEPCVDPTFGWMGTDGCYYKLDTGFHPPAWDTADQPPPGEAGAYYDMTCAVHFNIHGTGGGTVWLPAGAAPGSPPSPAALARQARNSIVLPVPAIEMSPARQQLVNLPTWLWITPGSWTGRSATAAVPGESVTASAAPRSVVWSTGDGVTVTCSGPGTPYTTSVNPASASPDCGHTYLRSSAGLPDGVFTVTVTVRWSVDWAGGGQRGVLPDLTTTAALPVAVGESQTLTTR